MQAKADILVLFLQTLVGWIFRRYFSSFTSVAGEEFTSLEVLEDSRGRLFSPLNPEGYDVLLLERLSWNNFSMGQNIFRDLGKRFPYSDAFVCVFSTNLVEGT